MPHYAKLCVLWLSNAWSICKCFSNALRVVLQVKIHPRPSHFWHSPSPCYFLCSKSCNVAWFAAKKHVLTPCREGGSSALLLRDIVATSTHHVSNVSSRILSLNPSLASSPRRWSNARTMSVSSQKKWRCLLSAHILSNMQADPQALWPSSCWRGQTNRHLLVSCTQRTCDKQKWCWTNSSSYECCKGPSIPPLVFLQFFNVRKLVVRQVEVDDEHCLLHVPLCEAKPPTFKRS